MSVPVMGHQAPIFLVLDALERCLAELSEADALVAAALVDAAIVALRREMMLRGIEPDADQSIGATT